MFARIVAGREKDKRHRCFFIIDEGQSDLVLNERLATYF